MAIPQPPSFWTSVLEAGLILLLSFVGHSLLKRCDNYFIIVIIYSFSPQFHFPDTAPQTIILVCLMNIPSLMDGLASLLNM